MEEINKYILGKAIEADICKPWAEMITSTDSVDGLLAMYVKGIDFCLEKNFPSNDDLVRLGGDKLAIHGIYVDAAIDTPEGDFHVLLGNCHGIIYAGGYQATQVFVKHSSSVSVIVKDQAFVVIDCFDNARVDVEANGKAKVQVNIYGNAQVNPTGDGFIKIIHKNKQSY